jgi:hypothetical protein
MKGSAVSWSGIPQPMSRRKQKVGEEPRRCGRGSLTDAAPKRRQAPARTARGGWVKTERGKRKGDILGWFSVRSPGRGFNGCWFRRTTRGWAGPARARLSGVAGPAECLELFRSSQGGNRDSKNYGSTARHATLVRQVRKALETNGSCPMPAPQIDCGQSRLWTWPGGSPLRRMRFGQRRLLSRSLRAFRRLHPLAE